MTKLSISLAAAMFFVTFVSAASAYSTEPVSRSFASISQVAMSTPQTADVEGACIVQITPILAAILNLSDDRRGGASQPQQTSLACAQE